MPRTSSSTTAARLTAVADGNGTLTTYEYDERGLRKAEHQHLDARAVPGSGSIIQGGRLTTIWPKRSASSKCDLDSCNTVANTVGVRGRTRGSFGQPKVKTLERPCLVQIHGPDLGRVVFLDGPLTTFGRALDCDVVVEAENVSRWHCTIMACADGVVARDDRSTNGTFVNDERVKGERLLAPGDLVRLGSVVFKLLAADRASGVEAQYHDALYRLTVTDALTELYNRRYLLQFLEREIARATRHRRALAILLIDIDHFKDVNDRHGHLAGDFVLRELAAILRDRTRREECLARYGGEELCLVLPEAVREDAVRRGDDLRRVCEKHEFVFEDRPIPVTFSAGVAAMTAGMGPLDLLKAADERLYAAKRSGRNRIC